ncbi:MAG: hypothetical protein KGH57_04295 [Candidatus Micrarchaeota archaeon]|nr:hypothetical protein [Candidatus Micrarchaeota archaeon]
MQAKQKSADNPRMIADASTSAERFGHVLLTTAREFVINKVHLRAQELEGKNSPLASELVAESKYIGVNLRNNSRNYIKLTVSYSAADSTISIPTGDVAGRLRVVVDKYTPISATANGAKAEMFAILRESNKELIERVLSDNGIRAKSEDHINLVMFDIPIRSLNRLPDVRLSTEDLLVQTARATNFPMYISDMAKRNLEIVKRTELFRFRLKEAELQIAASLICAFRDGALVSDYGRDNEVNRYATTLSSYVGISYYSARRAAELLKLRKERHM